MVGDKLAVFDFFQEATANELIQISNLSLKKAEAIIECRPFKTWTDLVRKFQNTKYLDVEMINAAQVGL